MPNNLPKPSDILNKSSLPKPSDVLEPVKKKEVTSALKKKDFTLNSAQKLGHISSGISKQKITQKPSGSSGEKIEYLKEQDGKAVQSGVKIYTGLPNKPTAKYKVENGEWFKQNEGDKWTQVKNEASIDLLNTHFKKNEGINNKLKSLESDVKKAEFNKEMSDKEMANVLGWSEAEISKAKQGLKTDTESLSPAMATPKTVYSENKTAVGSFASATEKATTELPNATPEEIQDRTKYYQTIDTQKYLKSQGYDVDVDGNESSKKTVDALNQDKAKFSTIEKESYKAADVYESIDKDINESLIGASEEDVVKQLRNKYSKDGFLFEENGMGDKMTIKYSPVNGVVTRELTIDLDNAFSSSDNTEALKMKDFMKQVYMTKSERINMSGEEDDIESQEGRDKYMSKLTKLMIDNPYKYGDKLVDEDWLNNHLNDSYRNINIDKKQLEDDYKKLKLTIDEYDKNPNEEDRAYINNKIHELSINEYRIASRYKDIGSIESNFRKLAGIQYAKKGKKGNFPTMITGSLAQVFESFEKIALETAIDVLPYALGQDVFDPITRQKLVDDGMSDDQILDFAAKKIKRDILPDVKEGIQNIGSLGMTTSEYGTSEERWDITKAANFLAESIGAALLGGGNPTLTKIAFFSQSYNSMQDQMRGEEFDRLTESEKKLISVPYGLVIGALEKIGLDFTKSGAKNPFVDKIINNTLSTVFKSIPKDASISTIKREINKNIGAWVSSGILRTAGGAAFEGITEGTQQLAEISIKNIANGIIGEGENGFEYFQDVPDLLTVEGIKKAFEIAKTDAYFGMLGGGVMTSGSVALSSIKEQGYKKKADSEFDIFFNTMNDNNLRSMAKMDVKLKFKNNELSKDEAKEMLSSIDQAASIVNSIPIALSLGDKRESYNLLIEKKKLEKEISGKDENLVAVQKARIVEINNELTKISEDATKESNVEQQEVTAEGSVSEYKGTSEGQPEVGISEGSQRETEKPKADSGDSVIPSEVQEEVTTLRSEEQTELSNAIPNIDEYKVDGKVDKTLMTPEDLSKYNKIYDKYDKLITPLLSVKQEEAVAIESNDAKVYSSALSEAKKEMNKKGTGLDLQVSSVSEQEAQDIINEGGKVFMTEDGSAGAYVKKDGYMGGLFKSPKSSFKNVSKVLQSARIKAGGYFMDAYATKLEKIYINNGFRPIARLKFNEEYAPEGWDAEGSPLKNKPDVVFFTYDPNGTYNEGDGQLFEDYDAAYEFAKSQKLAQEGPTVEQEVEAIGQLISGTDAQIDQKTSEVFTEKRMAKIAARAIKALSRILPEVKFIVYETNEDYKAATKEGKNESSGGTFDPSTNTIHINLSLANSRTVAHEVFHAILINKVKTDANAAAITKRMVQAIASKIDNNPELKKKLENFISNYDENIQNEEKLAELVGILAENYNSFSTSIKDIITRWIDKLANIFTLDPFNRNETYDMLNTIARKVAKGKVISKADVKIIEDVDNGESFKNQYVSTNGTVVTTPSNRKSIVIGTVVNKSDLIDPNTLVGKPLEVVYYDNFTSSPYELKNRISGSTIKRVGEGGPGYSYRPEIKKAGIIAAFTNVTKVLNSIQGIRSRNNIAKNNSVIGVALQNKETGHLGNKTTERDFYSPSEGVIAQAIKDKLITENEAVVMLKGAVDAYSATSKGSDPKSSLGFTSNDFLTLDDFYKKIGAVSFERRGTFNAVAIPSKEDLKITKATKPYIVTWLNSGIPTLKEYFNATTEQYTKEAEAHDIVKYLDPELNKIGVDSSVNISEKEIERAKDMGVKIETISSDLIHTSYPVVLFGKNIGVPTIFHSVRDMSKDWDVPNPFFKAGRRSDKAQPITIPETKASEKRPSTRKQLPTETSAKLTKDKNGNFVFHHYSNQKRDVIKPGTGENIITGKEEGGALSSVGGLAMYYTMDNQVEPGVGNVLHTVLVPNGKVYDFNSDPENLYDEAKKRFEVARSSQSFSPNYQLAFITQVANENGYDMVVARWRNNELRAQTTMTLETSKNNIPMKPIAEETYKVGDDVEVYGSKGKITSIYGDTITYKGEGVSGEINFKRFPKSISKQITQRKQIAEEVTGIEETISPRKQKPKTINDIVKLTKDQGFSDAAIRQYLKDQRYSDKQATASINEYNVKKEGIFVKRDGGIPTRISDSIKSFKRRIFSARAFLPKSVFSAKENKEAAVARHLNIVDQNVKDFNRLYSKYKGDKKELVKSFDLFIRGNKDVELSEEFIKVATSMRNQIDGLSQQLIDSGLVDAYMAKTITDNLGTYLTRSYKLYDRKNWKKEVEEEVKQKAINLLKSQYKEMAQELSDKEGIPLDEALDNLVTNRLDELLTEEGASNFITGSKLGSKDLSVLKEKQDIPIEIRMLMGEYSDPGLNYAKTVLKLSSLAANHKFLTEIKKNGMGTYFFEKNDPRRPAAFNTMIATEGSENMNPLNGLYTTKEMADAFMAQPSQLSDFWKIFMKFQSAIRYSKTILSVATHIKNVFGNIGFVWINAHFDPKEVGRAFMTVKTDFSKGNNQQRREKMNNYISLGIVKQSAGLGEIMDMFKDANWDTAMASRLSNEKVGLLGKAKRFLLQGKKKVEDAYQAEDDFFKIIAYENELSRYSKALFDKKKTELTEEELAEVNKTVVEIVKNTYPTYDRIPEAIKMIRRAPFIGNFVSFQAESYRTAYNTIALAKNELTSKNPNVKKIGVQRLVGASTYLSAKSAILAYFSIAAGTGLTGLAGYLFDDDNEERKDKDIREFVAPWSPNSDLVMISVGKGKIKYIDFSSSDPHGALKKVMNAFFLGESTIDSFIDGIGETFSPFIGEDMTIEALLALKNNQDKYGNPIYNTEESLKEQSDKVLSYMYKLVEPGTFSSIRRGWEAEDKTRELIANLTGYRTYDVDVTEQFGYKIKDYSDRIKDAKKIYNSEYYNEDATDAQKKKAYDKSTVALNKIYKEVIGLYNSAERLGCLPEDLETTMKDFGGISKENITEIQSGKIPILKKKDEEDKVVKYY